MTRTQRLRRRGFTLLELLTVIAIIGILLSIGIAVWSAVLSPSRAAATRATIAKIDNFVRERMQAFDRNIGNKAYDGDVIGVQSNWNVPQAIARIIVIKNARKAIFPQYLADPLATAQLNPGLRAILDKFRTDSRLPAFVAAKHKPETESSELLYYVLTHGDALGIPPVGEDEFSSSEVQDTDDDGRMEFVDAWGKPLRFYVYPTRLIHPDGIVTSAPTPAEKDAIDLLIYGTRNEVLQQDPDDPKGVFATWTQTPPAQAPNKEGLWHTPFTYHVPLIVSVGEDGALGLYEPYEAKDSNNNWLFGHLARPRPEVFTGGGPNESALNDNITNYQQGG